MMNKKKLNFWLDVILLVLFAATVLTLFGRDRGTFDQPQVVIHCVAGTLMLLGSAVHIAWHWDWIRTFDVHPSGKMAKQVRSRRGIDIWLLVVAAPCGATGLVTWLMQAGILSASALSLRTWAGLHNLTGMATLLIMLVHLVQHRKWVAYAARHILKIGASKPLPKPEPTAA
jgi:hypothetical protein